MPTIRWSRIHPAGVRQLRGSPSQSHHRLSSVCSNRVLSVKERVAPGAHFSGKQSSERMRSVVAAGSCRRGRGSRAPRGWVLAPGLKHSPFQPHRPARHCRACIPHHRPPESRRFSSLWRRTGACPMLPGPTCRSSCPKARAYGTATNFYAISHPSLPNYLVLAGGSTFGVADDDVPAAHRLHGRSLFG